MTEQSIKNHLLPILKIFGCNDLDIKMDEDQIDVDFTVDDRLIDENYFEWGSDCEIILGKVKTALGIGDVIIDRRDAFPNGYAWYQIQLYPEVED